MHPATTMKHGSHPWHDRCRLILWHHASAHLHSRHFWAGVVVTLLVVGILALLFILASNAPLIVPPEMPPYVPYGL